VDIPTDSSKILYLEQIAITAFFLFIFYSWQSITNELKDKLCGTFKDTGIGGV
jgi:hypothetical protein